MDIIINLNLNIDPSSPVGLRINYLTNCLQQLSNLYSTVSKTSYNDSLNDCLLSMVQFIEADNIQGAIDQFNIDITDIQIEKEAYFAAYSEYFYNQYTPPT